MSKEITKKEESDRNPLKKESDEESLTIREVLDGLEMKPFNYKGIGPEDYAPGERERIKKTQ